MAQKLLLGPARTLVKQKKWESTKQEKFRVRTHKQGGYEKKKVRLKGRKRPWETYRQARV